MTSLRYRGLAMLTVAMAILCAGMTAQTGTHAKSAVTWRPATEAELHAILPARAPVISERIETEQRASSGIVSDAGRYVAGILLITAGYSAEGKYSYYLINQATLKIGEMTLRPGNYLFGWVRKEDALDISFYEAATGKPLGMVEAKRDATIRRVESFRIWPPEERSMMQLGRFTFKYRIEP